MLRTEAGHLAACHHIDRAAGGAFTRSAALASATGSPSTIAKAS